MGRTKCGGWVALALLTIASCGGRPDTRVNGDMAFVGVNVLPMDSERVLENQTVVVDNGRIVAIGSSDEVGPADGVDVIEAAGHYLMPGLTEMHGHLPNPQTSDTDAQNLLFLYVANGVTTVRGMQGHPSQFAVRDQIDRGSIIGPRLFLGSVSINGARVSSPEQAEQLVREYKVQGYDLIKTLEGLSVETYDAVARTAAEVRIPFGGHVPNLVGLRHALASGQVSIDHLDNYIEALVPETAQPDEWPGTGESGRAAGECGRIPHSRDRGRDCSGRRVGRAHDGAVGDRHLQRSPLGTLSWQSDRKGVTCHRKRSSAGRRPSDERFAASDVETNRRLAALRRTILRSLYEGGANIALGTDSPQTFSVPGFSAHREMRALRRHWYDAIRRAGDRDPEASGVFRCFRGLWNGGRRPSSRSDPADGQSAR